MKNLYLLSILLSVFGFVNAQHQVGHYNITFIDPDRGNRAIESEVYYPATVAGDNTPVASGDFPVIVFGHGFVMAWSAYENLWEEFVPRGYIMVFPRTEGNAFNTNHQRFGWDLQFLVTRMQAEGQDASSPIFGAVNPKTALMGHSMGGGAAFLAADSLCTNGNTNLKTLIGLAPAESTSNGVSSINSALSVTVPSIVLSGSQDGVTPPVDHHIPMYDNLASDCKTFINVVGGAHCYFANSNFNCDFGEGTSSSGISISRTQQHQVTFDFVNLWLDFTLKSECETFSVFQDSLNNSSRITFNQSCNYSLPSISASISPVSCHGGSDGTVSLSISGGIPGYTEDWNGENPNALSQGTYNVIVTDAEGCEVEESFVVTEPTEITATATITDENCGLEDGVVSFSISGGTGTYTEDWNGENPNALSAGTYIVIISDDNNCEIEETVTVQSIGGPTVIVNTTPVSCFGGNDGTATLQVSGGLPGYTEDWNGENPNALSEGTYSVIVSDANGCETQEVVEVTAPDELLISTTVLDEICGQENGSANVVISGGIAPYFEDWNGDNPNALSEGTYDLVISDANGCEVQESITVGLIEGPEVNVTTTSVSCNGGNDGTASIIITGGTPNYIEDWGGFNPNALGVGTYNLIVTDQNGCFVEETISITEPQEISIVPNVTAENCGQGNGVVALSVSGGMAPYNENWFGENPNALSSGSYSVEVTDNNGCVVNETVSVGSIGGPTIVSEITDVSCFGENDGSVAITISGGTPNYTENWNGVDPTQLPAGSYTLEVSDADGCTTFETITISEPSQLTATATTADDSNGSNGSISVQVNGGTGMYSYSLDGINFQSNATFSGLSAGNYTVYVTDENDCEFQLNVTVAIDPTSSVEELFSNLKVYPNPVNDILNVILENHYNAPTEISLMDVSGKVIYKNELSQGQNTLEINMQPVAKGFYQLVIRSGKSFQTVKIVK